MCTLREESAGAMYEDYLAGAPAKPLLMHEQFPNYRLSPVAILQRLPPIQADWAQLRADAAEM